MVAVTITDIGTNTLFGVLAAPAGQRTEPALAAIGA
jgi:hypothetical protein